ncbi:amidohydrolase [Eubacterium sp.]|uniref:amidohydrolase n=1 Tax=Eubacterium sp. TaxID=142586 RepID=UPI002FC7A4EF
MKKGSIALVGGKIITMEPHNPEASAILVEEGIITLLGDDQTITTQAAEKGIEQVDLAGRCAVPGLHDCHVHVMGTGIGATGVDLYDAGNIRGVLDLILQAAQDQPHGWIYGTRLDESRLEEKRAPTATEIDTVMPNRGVFLVDRGLHYTQLNTKAFQAIGFQDEDGILWDVSGRPTGRVHGEANGVAKTYYNDKMSDEQRIAAIQYVSNLAVSKGVTTIHAMEGGTLFSDADIPVFNQLQGELPLDILMYWDTSDLSIIEEAGYPRMGTDILLDGSIGSRTAAFDTPYADDPNTCGILYFKQEDVNHLVESAFSKGLQSGFHAIGPCGIRMALDALEYALEKNPVADHRYRIEHFGFPDDRDILRAKRLGAIISTQPSFSYLRGGPGSVYNLRTGDEREEQAYSLRRYTDAGLMLCGGSDSSVTPIDPILGIHAAVNPPYAQNALTPQEALAMFTTNAAYAAFEEDCKGSLKPGKLGDITILSDDPLSVLPQSIGDIQVEATIVRGTVVYHKSLQQ